MTPQDIPALLEKHGSLKAIARAKSKAYTTINRHYRRAVGLGIMEAIPMGAKSREAQKHVTTKQRIKAMKPEKLAPKKGAAKWYIITSAQNNTRLHEGLWRNLIAFKDYLGAELMVSTFLYYKHSRGQEGMAKEKGGKGDASKHSIWYDEKIIPYVYDQRAELANGLVFCGELNIIPTAEKPLSGLEVFTGRHSMIVPHAKLALDSIATVGGRGTKLNYTTGACTLRNYIQRKEGFKAEFHHCYGALLVEVDEDGHWWVRQLNGDSKGTFYDLDLKVENGEVTLCPANETYVEAINFGDTHVEELDPVIDEATWGEGGIVDRLRPKRQIHNDLNTFYARGHHNIKNPFKMFKRYVTGEDNVKAEIEKIAAFVRRTARPWSETVVIDSNHHRHPTRWLAEQDGRHDPVNALYWAQMLTKTLEHIKVHGEEPNFLEIALAPYSLDVHFVDGRSSYVICRDNGGGIECGLHGDRGPNGARGNVQSFARMGRRTNTGHSHVARIVGGAWSAGTKGKLRTEYNDGPSSWSHSDIVTYRNGKRAILTAYAGKYWA